MSHKINISVPLNRVEGDLEVRAEVEDGVVINAWCSGTMYRGFEKILMGRGALDGLVLTPRLCGICSTSHLAAAARALDQIGNVTPPPDAVRIRNAALMTEHIQSDMRHAFLMFAADFVNPVYRNCPLFDEAVRRYEAFKGTTAVETIRETKKLLEIISIIGGQWPHSSYMVPGGLVSIPNSSDLLHCKLILSHYRKWYENRILGCTMDRWLSVRSGKDLDIWLDENESHRNSEMGFYIRFSREIGLDKIGHGHDNFISFGYNDLLGNDDIVSDRIRPCLVRQGFIRGKETETVDQKNISEHVAFSWFEDYGNGRHPSEGETKPYASGKEGKQYSWAKAPRYNGFPAETGPLAELLVSNDPLSTDLMRKSGANVFVRELARLMRTTRFLPVIECLLNDISGEGKFYVSPGEIKTGEGFGLIEAARGALGHWVKIENGIIQKYQIITPTAWNASPRDSNSTRGPMEEALLGTEVKNILNPVELGHVVRSFDACLVCTVHTITHGKKRHVLA